MPSRSVVQVVARSEELWSSISLKRLLPERPEMERWPEDAVPALLTNSLLDSSSCHSRPSCFLASSSSVLLPSLMMILMSSPATIVFVCWTLVEAAPFTFRSVLLQYRRLRVEHAKEICSLRKEKCNMTDGQRTVFLIHIQSLLSSEMAEEEEILVPTSVVFQLLVRKASNDRSAWPSMTFRRPTGLVPILSPPLLLRPRRNNTFFFFVLPNSSNLVSSSDFPFYQALVHSTFALFCMYISTSRRALSRQELYRNMQTSSIETCSLRPNSVSGTTRPLLRPRKERKHRRVHGRETILFTVGNF